MRIYLTFWGVGHLDGSGWERQITAFIGLGRHNWLSPVLVTWKNPRYGEITLRHNYFWPREGWGSFSKINCGSHVRFYAMIFKLPLEYMCGIIWYKFYDISPSTFSANFVSTPPFIKEGRVKMGPFCTWNMFWPRNNDQNQMKFKLPLRKSQLLIMKYLNIFLIFLFSL